MKYLQVQRAKKWLSDADVCVGDVSIRKLEELFNMTPKVMLEYIRGSVLFLAPTRVLKSQSVLDILCSILGTPISCDFIR
jgi:hypothetical protein